MEKNMRKKYLVLAIVLFFILITNKGDKSVFLENRGFEERFNDRQIMDVVKSISEIAGVREVAVLSRNGKILAGILTETPEDREEIILKADKNVKEKFPGFVVRKIFVEDDTALDIIELSYYIESDIEPKILKKRFDFLMDK